MQCPVCDVTLSISSREGIEIDFCPQCRGVWLDRGELDKVIERAAPEGRRGLDDDDRRERAPRYDDGTREPRSPVREERYDPRYDKRRRRRSLLEDIFDFD